jgi:hypothetical protein
MLPEYRTQPRARLGPRNSAGGRSALRFAISAAQAAETADSSPPSKLSSNANSKAEPSCGISASASPMTWSKWLFMMKILVVVDYRKKTQTENLRLQLFSEG